MSMTNVNQDKEHNKICLFGGTFDPIHKGHIDMARIAADIYGFNKVYILPTGNSYLKSNVSDTEKELLKNGLNSGNIISKIFVNSTLK